MDKKKLVNVIGKFGAAHNEDIEGLLVKLNFIENNGKYGRLIKSISSANDKSNFFADVFEATFAYQFEASNLPLKYEVKQDNTNNSSIDFLRRTNSGISIYLEARLLQQDYATTQSIKDQLDANQFYRIAKNGSDEHDAIVRLQNVILSKVQKKDGTPVKFLTVDDDSVNIVVIEVSELVLGTIDIHDCLLSTHGDPYVEDVYRRGIFGLFQQPREEYSEFILGLAKFYEHIRKTLSGVLFVFKKQYGGFLDYRLEHYMVWNPNLVDQELAKKVCREISQAVPNRA
ncbi:hypothetical protein MNBD_GAMMA12-356 [hydrothermal vent metagenome]|uniref:Uncharacterized protein n=1 Tax=hydrothermal vent metagenome TaxID=652676 RepID=A0A3B0YUN4_9ZZZZ